MEILKITSAQNPTIKKIAKLSQSSKARKDAGLIVLDGEHLCEEWNGQFEYVVSTQEAIPFTAKQIIIVPASLMTKIAPTKSPSGILGLVKRPVAEPATEAKLVLLLESVQDPGNIGTIIRTAAASGVEAIFLNVDCADIWSPKVLRAGMGGHFKLQLIENYDLTKIKNDFDGPLYGTFMNGENLFRTNLPDKCGFVLGNEGAGISKELATLCDHKVSIPMQNNVESLNVAIAAGLCMYEHFKQNA